jgi:dienelactone hydrolase
MQRTSPALSYEGGDVRAWQQRLKRKLRQLLGLPRQATVPLNARTLWKRGHELGSIEKLVFTSEPCADVPAYLCLPRDAKPPYPVLICLQGHTTGMHISIGVSRQDETSPFSVEGERDYALQCMARGVAAFCIEQRSFGERAEKVQEQVSALGCHDAAMHALMLGRTLAGERVLDVDRAMDYLEARGDVDMSRLGVMGDSGGGTVTIYAAALLPRVRMAVPACCFCTYRASIMSTFHCADNYVPGLLNYAEMPDILGLFAPRPVIIVAGEQDPIFPIHAARRAFSHLKRIYHAAGADRQCHLVVGKAGHQFYPDIAWPRIMREINSGNGVGS